MAINNLWIPVPVIFHVLEEADPKFVERVQHRVVVVGTVLIYDQTPTFQCLSKPAGIGSGGRANKCHHDQVPLFGSKGELVVSCDYGV